VTSRREAGCGGKPDIERFPVKLFNKELHLEGNEVYANFTLCFPKYYRCDIETLTQGYPLGSTLTGPGPCDLFFQRIHEFSEFNPIETLA
jgi:hypothetical protein